MRKGREIEIIQVPGAERDLAVATASILARDKFIGICIATFCFKTFHAIFSQ